MGKVLSKAATMNAATKSPKKLTNIRGGPGQNRGGPGGRGKGCGRGIGSAGGWNQMQNLPYLPVKFVMQSRPRIAFEKDVMPDPGAAVPVIGKKLVDRLGIPIDTKRQVRIAGDGK